MKFLKDSIKSEKNPFQPLFRLIERNIFNSDGSKRVASEVEQVTFILIWLRIVEQRKILSIVDNEEYLIRGSDGIERIASRFESERS